MRKGFLASVAALTAGAGVALGQGAPGVPTAAPQGFPTWPGAGPGAPTVMAPPPGPADYLTGMRRGPGAPDGAAPAAYTGGDLPPATDMPLYGPVSGPGMHPGAEPLGGEDGYEPKSKWGPKKTGPQIHKAAGGPDRWYIDLEELAWRVRAMPIHVPLVTASPPASLGVLGQEGTRVLYGDNKVDYGDYLNVFRLTGGIWDSERRCGIELSGFIQEAKHEFGDFFAPLNGREVLARPFTDALTGQPTAVLVGLPGVFAGEVHVASQIKMGGAEANLLRSLMYCDRFKLNLLAGVRYLDLSESLDIVSRSTEPETGGVAPTVVDIVDSFSTRNQFFGGQLGFQTELRRGRYFMDMTGKVGLGDVNQQLNINGFTNVSLGGATVLGPLGTSVVPLVPAGAIGSTTAGGLLALAGNITRENRDRFAYLPELTIKLGYQWTQRISTYVGYNVLYIDKVLRPSEQIDPVINPVFLPVATNQFGNNFGPVRPINTFRETDFWAQGVTFGVSIRY